MMTIILNDGTHAFLEAISQTQNYRGGGFTPPKDPIAELRSMAEKHFIPAGWPPRKPKTSTLVVEPEGISLQNELQVHGYKWWRNLPEVMCVGDFMSYRGGREIMKPTWLRIVWLQRDFEPHISPTNLKAIQAIEWDTAVNFKAHEHPKRFTDDLG